MLSKALTKSTKLIESRCWCSRVCSIIDRKTNICSLHDRPCRNPACCSRSWLSTDCCSRRRSTMQKTFPGTDSRVIPRQLLHFVRSPFFGSRMIIPRLQYSGTTDFDQQTFIKLVRAWVMLAPPHLSISGATSSSPAALPFFNKPIAILVSSSEIRSRSTGRSASGGVRVEASYVMVGSGWLSVSPKCSIQLFSWSSFFNNGFPALSSIGAPFLSIQSRLSWRQLRFTCRSIFRYSSSAASRVSSHLASSRRCLACLLSSIRCHDLSWIHYYL